MLTVCATNKIGIRPHRSSKLSELRYDDRFMSSLPLLSSHSLPSPLFLTPPLVVPFPSPPLPSLLSTALLYLFHLPLSPFALVPA